jgi:hypothetical protein
MVYTPVMTSGFKVQVVASDREYTVHVAGSRGVICGTKENAKVPAAPIVAASLQASDKARAALAARLHIAASSVRVASTRPYRAGTTVCAGAAAQPKGAAFVVEAVAGGRTYHYYVDAETTTDCEATPPR